MPELAGDPSWPEGAAGGPCGSGRWTDSPHEGVLETLQQLKVLTGHGCEWYSYRETMPRCRGRRAFAQKGKDTLSREPILLGFPATLRPWICGKDRSQKPNPFVLKAKTKNRGFRDLFTTTL